MVSLGNWQVSRAAEKRALQARYDDMGRHAAIAVPASRMNPEDVLFRRVEATGEFVPEHMIYLDNKIHRGAVGYQVVMPLRIGNGPMHVLVNRGWAPAGGDRSVLPAVATPRGPVKVEGMATVPTQKILELSPETVQGRVWENLVLERYEQRMPIRIQPVVIEQTGAAGDGLVREWERPDAGVGKHQVRALTWYLLALTVAIIYVVVNVRRIEAQP
ncbi:MAG: SURF1 family protein [Betaproteobacteria bacterium]|nr:SURF1 family protein [Betaproteobacteria bacterium]